MLADEDALAGLEMDRGDVARRVTAERDLARRLRLDQQQRHPAEHAALESLLQRMQADLHLRVLPQQHVVLEVHRDLSVERHVQDGDELALEPVVHPRARCPAVIWVGRICGADGMRPLVHADRRSLDCCSETVSPWARRQRPGTHVWRRQSVASRRTVARDARASFTSMNDIGVRPIYVTGHRNPDTDSIASAIGYAELKCRLDPQHDYVPVRLGECNPQTRWLLERSGATEPQFLPHVLLRACDVMQTEFPVAREDEPIRAAGIAMARAELELVPIVDDDGALTRRRHRTDARAPVRPRDP